MKRLKIHAVAATRFIRTISWALHFPPASGLVKAVTTRFSILRPSVLQRMGFCFFRHHADNWCPERAEKKETQNQRRVEVLYTIYYYIYIYIYILCIHDISDYKLALLGIDIRYHHPHIWCLKPKPSPLRVCFSFSGQSRDLLWHPRAECCPAKK